MSDFTEQETPEGYYLLFKRTFEIIRRLTGESINFYYLHGPGLHAVVLDMCNKQMSGIDF